MNPLRLLRDLATAGLDLLYPPACAGCNTPVPRDRYLCGVCLRDAPKIEPPFCKICSQPFDGAIEGAFRCPNCADLRFDFEFAVAACRSRGLVRQLIHRFKYRGEFHLRHPLSDWLRLGLRDPRVAGRRFDVLCPVPLHAVRLREREFNQAAVLAEAVCHDIDAPVENLLRRIRATETQTHFDRKQRMENLRGAFALSKNADVRQKNILLLDDVFTTGSTVQECSRVLRRAGAASVCVLAVARG